MLDLVFDIPLLIVGPVVVVLMGSLAAAGLLFVRRRVLPRLRITEEDGVFVSTMVHSVMVFYALTVALIAISVWEKYSEAGTASRRRRRRSRCSTVM